MSTEKLIAEIHAELHKQREILNKMAETLYEIDEARWLDITLAKKPTHKPTDKGGFAFSRCKIGTAWGQIKIFGEESVDFANLNEGAKLKVLGEIRKGKPWVNNQGTEVIEDELIVRRYRVVGQRVKAAGYPAPQPKAQDPMGFAQDDDIVF